MIGALLFQRRLRLAVVLFVVFGMTGWAQVNPFTLAVTATDESCTANGTLHFNVSNITPGATVIYTIYHLPNNVTPIAVLSANTFTGLVAGNYRVVAVQSLGNASKTQVEQATIANVIVPIQFSLITSPELCGNDGRIEVYDEIGTAVSYEIIAGPVIRPLQTSNAFENLPSGTYTVRVFDNCGEGVVAMTDLNALPTVLTLGNATIHYVDCGQVTFSPTFYAQAGMIAFPVNLQVTIDPANGPPLVYNFLDIYEHPIINLTEDMFPISYGMTVTDRCGDTYNQNNMTSALFPFVINALGTSQDCGRAILMIDHYGMIGQITVNFTQAPAGFNPLLFSPDFPHGDFFSNNTVSVPVGTYTVVVTDSCGHVAADTVTIGTFPPTGISWEQAPGCQVGYGSVRMITNDTSIGIATIRLTAAPPAYTGAVPFNFTPRINGGQFLWGSVPAGTYGFEATDNCGVPYNLSVTVTGYTVGATDVSITDNCTSFNMTLDHITNAIGADYWLQKFDAANNQWVHPETGIAGDVGFYYDENAYRIYNNTNNNYLPFSGVFRIVKTFSPFYTFSSVNEIENYCVEFLYNFEYYVGPRIEDVFSFECKNNSYNALVIATGQAPLIYRITTKNGLPFFVSNASSNVFLGLQPALYNFQIEDACGNILNSLFDISNPSELAITPLGFCNEQTAKLTVPQFSFLDYRWWKGNDTANILSTTNELAFPAFNPSTDNGLYHVRVFYEGNPNSCIDFVLGYQINVSPNAPNAGTGQNVSYCGNQNTVNLFSLLTDTFDTNGIWSETTSSGTLNGSLWNSTEVAPGNYEFHYTVTGTCNASDESIVHIQIKPMPETPIAFIEQPVCANSPLQLLATSVPFGTYEWSGPSGFTSVEQNPIIANASFINSGVYTVKSIIDGCESAESSVEIAVGLLPQMAITHGCTGNQYVVTASVFDDVFDPESVSYTWTGPDNFTSNQNPITITGGKKGMYTVTATTDQGCTVSDSATIDRTMCTIPGGISPNGDTRNEVLDLTGFGVLRFKIYNRYGRMVFEQDDYTDQWYGQDFNGNELTDATYYYYIQLDSGDEKTGWVYVSR